ncbi:MAG: hypothetical protein KGZ58_03835 [Ignavibacteriales bacterium]|nr:hypothetical protein [Ignavibacteriales bacterium]
MTDDILKEILNELKGVRQETINTNKRIDDTNVELKGLRQESINTNKRLDETNKRIDETNTRLDSLAADIKVLIVSSNETRDGMNTLRKVVLSNVIWQNDSITIDTTDGATIKGTIHKV